MIDSLSEWALFALIVLFHAVIIFGALFWAIPNVVRDVMEFVKRSNEAGAHDGRGRSGSGRGGVTWRGTARQGKAWLDKVTASLTMTYRATGRGQSVALPQQPSEGNYDENHHVPDMPQLDAQPGKRWLGCDVCSAALA